MSDLGAGSGAVDEPAGGGPVPDEEPVVVEEVVVEAVVAEPATGRRVGKTRNPWGVWALSLVTLGIYALWWYYTVNAEVRDYDRRVKVDPTVSLLALLLGGLTCGIVTVVSIWRSGERIASAQEASGTGERCSPPIGVVLALFVFGTWVVYYQSQLNKVWDQHGNPEPGTVV